MSVSARRMRTAIGAVLAAVAVALVFSPLSVAAVLHRPAHTSSQMINLRASWGGTLLGVAAFLMWLPALRPPRRFVVGLLLWSMAGIACARAVGFVLDGHPDTLQWMWLGAEVAIVALCALSLRSSRSAS